MKVLIYVDTSKEVGDVDHLKVLAKSSILLGCPIPLMARRRRS